MDEERERQRLEYGANLAVTALMCLRELENEALEELAKMDSPLERAELEILLDKVRSKITLAATSLLCGFLDSGL